MEADGLEWNVFETACIRACKHPRPCDTSSNSLSKSHGALSLQAWVCIFNKNSLKGKKEETLPAGERRWTHQSGRHTNPLSDTEACTFHLVQLREQPSIMLAGMWLEVWWSENNHSPPAHTAAVIRSSYKEQKHSAISSIFHLESFILWFTTCSLKNNTTFSVKHRVRSLSQKKHLWCYFFTGCFD